MIPHPSESPGNNSEPRTFRRRSSSLSAPNDRISTPTPTPPPEAFRSLPLSSRNVTVNLFSSPNPRPVISQFVHDSPSNIGSTMTTDLLPMDTSISSPTKENFKKSIDTIDSSDQSVSLTNTSESSEEEMRQDLKNDEGISAEEIQEAKQENAKNNSQPTAIGQVCASQENDEGTNYKGNLMPKILSESSENSSCVAPKKLLEVDLSVRSVHPGSRSPSVLSSHDDYSSKDSEKIENDLLRMKHLGFLLDQHRRRVSMTGEVWATDESSGNVSSEKSNNTHVDKESETSNIIQQRDLNKSLESAAGSFSTSGTQPKKDSSSSLFENFDKTWFSMHDNGATSKILARERLCFAVMVQMLMKEYKVGSSTNKTWGSVPVEVVKCFWRKIILCDNETAEFIDGLIKCLTERLRYITIQVADGQNASFSLSHEVYAQYARYILECDNISQEHIDGWNLAFVGELQNLLLIQENESSKSIPFCLKEYAVTMLPAILLNSMNTILPDVTGQHIHEREAYEMECLSCLVVMLRNQKYLQLRLEILGSSRGDLVKSTDVDVSTSNVLGRESDVLQATTSHVKDLENIASVISQKANQIKVGDDVYDTTRAGVAMYTSWKEACCAAMTRARAFSNALNDCAPVQSDDDDMIGSSHNSQSSHRRFKRSSVHAMMMPYSEACLTWKPKQFMPVVGEYKVDTLESKLVALPKKKVRSESRARTRGLGKLMNENRPVMALSDVLKISIELLSFETAASKAFFVLGESLASITSSKSLSFNRPTGQPMRLILTGVMGCTAKLNYCASALEAYLRLANIVGFLLSDELREVDEDDLVDLGYSYEDTEGADPSTRMKRLIEDRANAAELMRELDILIAEAFFALGNHLLCGNQLGQTDAIDMAGISLLNNLVQASLTSSLTGKGRPSDKAKILQCYQLSMQYLRLGMPDIDDETDAVSPTFDVGNDTYDSELDVVKIHQRILHTSVLHAIGIHYYEQIGDFDKAKKFLDDCANKRQLLLRQLRQDESDAGNLSSSSAGSVVSMRARRRGSYGLDGSRHLSESSVISNRRGRRRNKAPKKKKTVAPQFLCDDVSDRKHLLLGNGKTHKKCIESIELDLSSAMEFSALASHVLADSEAALSLFQDALILRALHSGKNCLDVADLQYNMGVIHDDLGQYESSLGRYGESLRVRYSHLEQLKMECSTLGAGSGTLDEIEDIESSVVLTLRCMTNVYHALQDYTNAISTNLKAVELLKDQVKRRGGADAVGIYSQQGSVLGFGKMNGNDSTVPLPKIILEEVRPILSHRLLPSPSRNSASESASNEIESSQDDLTRNEISDLYTNILSLLDDVKAQGDNNGHTSSGYTSSTPSTRSFLLDHHSITNVKRHFNQDHVRLETTFNLGLIAMHFGEHQKGVKLLEQALRTLWTSFPGDSSGESSDSDVSSSNRSADSSAETRQKLRKLYVAGQAEEGIFYHALALCHTALSDDERAIRCYITALRYYRRRFGMLNLVVSGALYDCATSYWNLCDFVKAEDFWADCLRILLSQDSGNAQCFASTLEIDIARTLYNIAATKVCKGEYFNQYTTTCLYDSLTIFKKKSKEAGFLSEEVAHAYFNLSLIHYNRGLHVMAGECLLGEEEDEETLEGEIIYTKEQRDVEELKRAMSCVDDALNSYLIGQKDQHPMQAHVAFVTGLINNAMGSVTQAVWNFKTSIRLLNKVYSPNNLYSASALYKLGDLLIGIGDTQEALKYFEECLDIRIQIVGRKDASVADVLFRIGGILADMTRYEKALEMEKECLQIRIDTEGNDGNGVAIMLFNIGLIYSRVGHVKNSLDYLQGALKVRKTRISTLENGDNTSDTDSMLRSEESELASVLHHIGNIHLKMENSSEAMAFYEEALSIWQRLCEFRPGPGGFSEFAQREDSNEKIELHAERLKDMADTLHNMGGVHETKQDFSRALNCYNQALVIKRCLLSETENIMAKKQSEPTMLDDFIVSSKTLSSAITLLRIGAIHVNLQNYDVSLSYYKSALKIQRKHLGRDHISVAQTLYEIGLILRQILKYAPHMRSQDIVGMEKAAVKYFKDSLTIAKNRYGANHQIVANVMFDIGSIHDRKGDYEEAISCYQHSVRVYGRVYASTLCRELFEVSSDGQKFNSIVEEHHGLFHPTALNGWITAKGIPKELRSQPQYALNEKGRDAYLKASVALAKAASQSGILGSNSFVEIAVFRILHCVVIYGVDPLRGSMKTAIEFLFGCSLRRQRKSYQNDGGASYDDTIFSA